jgi:hypothetical protein
VGSPQITPVGTTGTLNSGTGVTAKQPPGLNPFDATARPNTAHLAEMLPPMTTSPVGTVNGTITGVTTPYRTSAQLFTDALGSDTFAVYPYTVSSGVATDFLWKQCWEDDLLMTGVRSFDVKAYDNSYPGYVDLGWGDDGRLLAPYNTTTTVGGTATTTVTNPSLGNWSPQLLGVNQNGSSSPYVYGAAGNSTLPFTWPPNVQVTAGGGAATTVPGGITFDLNVLNPATYLYKATLAHEGRIPPLIWDGRVDPQALQVRGVQINVGDDTPSTNRLRRTWDTWSTDYSRAPATGVDPNGSLPPAMIPGAPYGLAVGGLPVYPSYPPPYDAPLRGIQIQIRVVDPKNERVKLLTIRQDFSDRP